MNSTKRFPAFDSWWLDVKLGMRMLRKYPGIALSGGFGIAAAVAIATGGYSVIHDNFFDLTLSLKEGHRIVSIQMWDSAANRPERRTLRDYQLWRSQLTSVQETSAFRNVTLNLIVPGAPPESVPVAAISASGFALARVQPLMGRYLQEDDERDGAAPVAVIAESTWRSRFASDPAVLGKPIQLGAVKHSIVGVMPAGFAFPLNHSYWIPFRAGLAAPAPLTGPEISVFGRLAPQSTLATAQAELSAVSSLSAQAFPAVYARLRPQVMPYAYPFLGINGTADENGLLAMQGLLVSLLVLVCLNVAILVYTRTALRQPEFGLRAALGASRGRIVAQLFLEALLLSAIATLAGIALAALAMHLVGEATAHIAADLPFWVKFRLSPQAVLYAAGLAMLSAAIVGVVPAFQATRKDVQSSLRMAGAGASAARLGRTWTVLIVAQVAFAVALLPPAVSSAWQDGRDGLAGLGFAASEYLSAELGWDGPPGRYPSLQAELARRLQADSRVSSVTFSLVNPGEERGARMEMSGAADPLQVRFNRVDVHFFPTFEVPILAGRGFQPQDTSPDAGTVVINQSLARRLLGAEAPGHEDKILGQRIRYGAGSKSPPWEGESGRWYQIAGIVSDFPAGVSPGMRDAPYKLYHAVEPGLLQPATMAIRIRGGASTTFIRRLRETTASTDPGLILRNVSGLDEALRREQWISRLQATVFVGVTLSVLLLAAAGIYSLMAFTVSQRRKEIGIRLALGAGSHRIVANIFTRALAQITAGAAVGVVMGVGLDKASGGELHRGHLAVALPVVVLAMIAVGVLAAWGPARRCLRIHPTDALREQ